MGQREGENHPCETGSELGQYHVVLVELERFQSPLLSAPTATFGIKLLGLAYINSLQKRITLENFIQKRTKQKALETMSKYKIQYLLNQRLRSHRQPVNEVNQLRNRQKGQLFCYLSGLFQDTLRSAHLSTAYSLKQPAAFSCNLSGSADLWQPSNKFHLCQCYNFQSSQKASEVSICFYVFLCLPAVL